MGVDWDKVLAKQINNGITPLTPSLTRSYFDSEYVQTLTEDQLKELYEEHFRDETSFRF
jgi:hypothetical protein